MFIQSSICKDSVHSHLQDQKHSSPFDLFTASCCQSSQLKQSDSMSVPNKYLIMQSYCNSLQLFRQISDCSKTLLEMNRKFFCADTHLLHNCATIAVNARITKLLIIMEQTFYQFGIAYLRWKDKNGNIWEAVKEQVEFFGKECFECNPEDNEGECTEENPYKYIDDWKEEHPNQSAVPFPEWI